MSTTAPPPGPPGTPGVPLGITGDRQEIPGDPLVAGTEGATATGAAATTAAAPAARRGAAAAAATEAKEIPRGETATETRRETLGGGTTTAGPRTPPTPGGTPHPQGGLCLNLAPYFSQSLFEFWHQKVIQNLRKAAEKRKSAG